MSFCYTALVVHAIAFFIPFQIVKSGKAILLFVFGFVLTYMALVFGADDWAVKFLPPNSVPLAQLIAFGAVALLVIAYYVLGSAPVVACFGCADSNMCLQLLPAVVSNTILTAASYVGFHVLSATAGMTGKAVLIIVSVILALIVAAVLYKRWFQDYVQMIILSVETAYMIVIISKALIQNKVSLRICDAENGTVLFTIFPSSEQGPNWVDLVIVLALAAVRIGVMLVLMYKCGGGPDSRQSGVEMSGISSSGPTGYRHVINEDSQVFTLN